MTTSDGASDKSTWLPNLVGGVSIWKLGADLNQERFFDGRLLEPEVEGADSLPTRVVWNVDRLMPLHEARASHPEDVRAAIEAFLGCVERVGKELSSSTSGFRKFKDAFSVPSLEGEGEASYFYDPAQKKLFVANWGASPRSIAGKGEVVFGYEAFGALLAATRAGLGKAPAAAPAPAAPVGADAPAAPADEAKKDDEKKKEEEEKKKEEGEDKKRPIWVWILAVLVGIAIVVLLLFFLRECRERELEDAADAGPDAALDAGTDGDAATDADAAADAAADAEADADAGDAATDAGADAEADAATDAGDDAGSDAGDDGGDGTGETPAGGDGEGPPAGGDGSGDGKIYIVPGGAGPGQGAPPPQTQGIPYRSHFQPGAKSWRITKGAKYLNRSIKPRMNNGSFEVFLEPGASFSQVQVEWKDPSGKWHVH